MAAIRSCGATLRRAELVVGFELKRLGSAYEREADFAEQGAGGQLVAEAVEELVNNVFSVEISEYCQFCETLRH